MITLEQRAGDVMERAKKNPLLLHELMPLQEAFTLSESKKKILFGGNRSGKSEVGADYVLNKARRNPGMRIWVAGVTFNDSVNIQQRKIWELLPKHEASYAKYNNITGFSNKKLEFINGSMIIFKSFDQTSEAFQGDDIDLIWLDEEPPKSVYDECRMRLLDRNGELILTMTSLNGLTDLIEEIFEGHEVIQSQYAEMVDKELPRIARKNDFEIFFLWTTENQYVNQQRLKDELRTLDSNEILCRVYGMPLNLASKIYPKFSIGVHVWQPEEIDITGSQIWNILDPHDRKPWAMIWVAVSKTGHAAVIHEYPFERDFNDMVYDDKTYDEYVKVIKSTEKVLVEGLRNKYVKRIIDPNFGNKTVQLAERVGGQAKTTPKVELEKRGLRYQDGIDAIEAGHMQVKEWLYWEAKKDEIIVQPRLIVSSACQNTIRHLSRYSRKDIVSADGDMKDKVGLKEAYKDFCFVAGTMIRTEYGLERIENIKVGDMVETDVGLKEVLASEITGYNRPTIKVTFSDGRILQGTPNHKIYLESGLNISLDLLRYGDIVKIWEGQRHTIGRLEEAVIGNSAQDLSIEKFGYHILETYQKACRYITEMVTSLTMIFQTLRLCPSSSIDGCILIQNRSSENYLSHYKREQTDRTRWLNGTEVKKAEMLLRENLKRIGRKENQLQEYVYNAIKNFRQKFVGNQSSVQTIAMQHGEGSPEKITKRERVLSAIKSLQRTNIQNQNAAPKTALVVVQVEQSSPATVYNLTVKDCHRYYANDILVANCDLIRYFVMSNPKFIDPIEFKPQLKKVY